MAVKKKKKKKYQNNKKNSSKNSKKNNTKKYSNNKNKNKNVNINKNKKNKKNSSVKKENKNNIKDISLELDKNNKVDLVDIEDSKDKIENDSNISNNNIDVEKICDNEGKKQYGDEIDNLELEKTIIVEPIEFKKKYNIRNRNNKNRYFLIVFSLLFIFLLVYIVMFIPRINIMGDSEIILSYKDNYVEPGYIAYSFNKDITDNVSVIGNVDSGVIGEYELRYYIDLFGIRVIKNRNISVVDMDKPKIDVDSDVINVCPNKDIPDFEYSAVDEYDGDITYKVNKTINENEVILSVSDLSGNSISKEIKIDRIDSVKPVIKLKGDSIMFLEYGRTYVEPGYSVSDNCSNNLDNKVKISGNVSREIGTYKLTYEVVDDSGNKSSVTRTIIVGTKVNDIGVVNTGTIYLTFDDGPNEGTTNKILDILKEEGVEATFFVTSKGPDYLIKRIYDEGHMVALHTATHDYSYIYSSVNNYFSDLNRVSDRVKRITGYDSKIIRFPGGSSNVVSRNYKIGIMTELSNLVLNQGYRYYDWNVDAMDASSARNSSDVYYNVTSNLSKNRANVVLMHDTKSITVGALRNIIRFGKEHGYSFKEIDMNTKMVRHGINN